MEKYSCVKDGAIGSQLMKSLCVCTRESYQPVVACWGGWDPVRLPERDIHMHKHQNLASGFVIFDKLSELQQK